MRSMVLRHLQELPCHLLKTQKDILSLLDKTRAYSPIPSKTPRCILKGMEWQAGRLGPVWYKLIYTDASQAGEGE